MHTTLVALLMVVAVSARADMRGVGQSAEPAQATGASESPATGGDITPPRAVKQTRPKYPQNAFDQKIEGEVVIEVMIDTKGRVTNARVIKSVPGLDTAAVDSVKKWRFTPALKNGKPIAFTAHLPVSFKIF
jgi:protein TonB